jgi:hypothetical protein
MYLARRRNVQDGIFQATTFRRKPPGRTGLKAGGYFLTLEACKGFEEHFRQQAKKRTKKKGSSRSTGGSGNNHVEDDSSPSQNGSGSHRSSGSPLPQSPISPTGLSTRKLGASSNSSSSNISDGRRERERGPEPSSHHGSTSRHHRDDHHHHHHNNDTNSGNRSSRVKPSHHQQQNDSVIPLASSLSSPTTMSSTSATTSPYNVSANTAASIDMLARAHAAILANQAAFPGLNPFQLQQLAASLPYTGHGMIPAQPIPSIPTLTQNGPISPPTQSRSGVTPFQVLSPNSERRSAFAPRSSSSSSGSGGLTSPVSRSSSSLSALSPPFIPLSATTSPNATVPSTTTLTSPSATTAITQQQLCSCYPMPCLHGDPSHPAHNGGASHHPHAGLPYGMPVGMGGMPFGAYGMPSPFGFNPNFSTLNQLQLQALQMQLAQLSIAGNGGNNNNNGGGNAGNNGSSIGGRPPSGGVTSSAASLSSSHPIPPPPLRNSFIGAHQYQQLQQQMQHQQQQQQQQQAAAVAATVAAANNSAGGMDMATYQRLLASSRQMSHLVTLGGVPHGGVKLEQPPAGFHPQ